MLAKFSIYIWNTLGPEPMWGAVVIDRSTLECCKGWGEWKGVSFVWLQPRCWLIQVEVAFLNHQLKLFYLLYNFVYRNVNIVEWLLMQMYRSPWSNKYYPPLDDGAVPSDSLRELEIQVQQYECINFRNIWLSVFIKSLLS